MPTTPQMIIIFAMVLTFAMFICSAFSAATATQQSKLLDNNETAAEDASREPSNLLRFVFTELPLVHHCNDSSQCPAAFGFTRCENHLCMCDESFYQVFNKTSETAYCRLCSMFQESCSVTQCCENPHATFCFNGLCVCRPGMDEECISGIYRGRYTPTLGIQLANTLSVSFAFVFLAITFIAVIRKTLFRCSFCRSDSMSRVSSDSSLNEFVKQKMQNRPPCYDDIEKDRKVPIFDYTNQPPPEYGATHFSRPGTFLQDTPNTSLSISNVVEMHMAPPNYSTFTTVTEVSTVTPTTTNAGDAIGRTTNDEIILTQPIYANREFSRLA